MSHKFYIDGDFHGRMFVVPVAQFSEFEKWLVENRNDPLCDVLDCLVELPSISSLRFTDYEIQDD